LKKNLLTPKDVRFIIIRKYYKGTLNILVLLQACSAKSHKGILLRHGIGKCILNDGKTYEG